MWKSLSHDWLCVTPWTVIAHQAPSSVHGVSPGNNTAVLSFLPGILPDPGIEPRPLALWAITVQGGHTESDMTEWLSHTHRPWNPERVSYKELILAGRKLVPAFCYGSSQQCPLLFLSSSETLKEKLKINVLLHRLGLIFSFLSLKGRQKLKNLQDLRFLINMLYTNCHLLSQSSTAEVME